MPQKTDLVMVNPSQFLLGFLFSTLNTLKLCPGILVKNYFITIRHLFLIL